MGAPIFRPTSFSSPFDGASDVLLEALPGTACGGRGPTPGKGNCPPLPAAAAAGSGSQVVKRADLRPLWLPGRMPYSESSTSESKNFTKSPRCSPELNAIAARGCSRLRGQVLKQGRICADPPWCSKEASHRAARLRRKPTRPRAASTTASMGHDNAGARTARTGASNAPMSQIGLPSASPSTGRGNPR